MVIYIYHMLDEKLDIFVPLLYCVEKSCAHFIVKFALNEPHVVDERKSSNFAHVCN